jgi:hypothetical protein
LYRYKAVQLLGSGVFQESKDRVELIQALWQGLHGGAVQVESSCPVA